MKVADPRLLIVAEAGEFVHVCVCEPEAGKYPQLAEMTGEEAEAFAIKILVAARQAQILERDRIEREEDEILRRAEMIWRSRNPGKPYLAAVS